MTNYICVCLWTGFTSFNTADGYIQFNTRRAPSALSSLLKNSRYIPRCLAPCVGYFLLDWFLRFHMSLSTSFSYLSLTLRKCLVPFSLLHLSISYDLPHLLGAVSWLCCWLTQHLKYSNCATDHAIVSPNTYFPTDVKHYIILVTFLQTTSKSFEWFLCLATHDSWQSFLFLSSTSHVLWTHF